jgi:hypothetical protein
LVQTANARWYEERKDDVHFTLATVFKTVRDESSCQLSADEFHAGLYRMCDAPGILGQTLRGYEYGPATLPYNVCRSSVDTLTSKTSKHRPLPQVLTQRGSWKNQKRARKMTQFIEGEFYRQKFFEEIWPDIIRDALIFGRGLAKIYADGEDIVTERVMCWEVFADSQDAFHGKPRNLYHCRSVDRDVAIATWARNSRTKAEAIREAGRFDVLRETQGRDTATTDRVDVIEAWHLPTRRGAKNGRHVVIVQGATLVDEVWELDYFPLIHLAYSRPVHGWIGAGLVEILEGYQYEINVAAEKTSEQHRLSGVHITCPDNARIHEQQIRSGITTLYHRPGGEPKVWHMDLVNEHTRQRPRELTQDALNEAGLSQLSVQSQKPNGITSGVALQNLDDFETERFMTFGRATHYLCVEAARRYTDCAKQIAAEHGDLAVSVPMKGGLLDLSWNDVVVEGIEYKVFNSSLLKDQPAARLEQLKDLFNTGLIGRGEFLRYLDAPDMEAELDLETADMLVIDEMIERMLDAEEEEGEAAFMAPSAYQNLQWGARRAQQKYNRALLDGAPEFNLDLLRRFMKQVDVELKKLVPPPVAPANTNMAPPGAPPPPTAVPPELPDLGIPGGAPPIAA